MSAKMTANERAALRAVEELFWREWNPIGVSVPCDEYDSYALRAFGLVRNGEPPERLVELLDDLEENWISMATAAETKRAVAEKAYALVHAWLRAVPR